MARHVRRTPSYRLHRPSGQAIVVLNGRMYYLGPHGTKASKVEYDRLIAEWLANGRQAPGAPGGFPDLSVNELLVRYLEFADGYYQRAGVKSRELENIRESLKPLKRLYGHTQASEFGPLALKSVRTTWIEAGLSRTTINARTGKLKRVFKWAVGEELVPPSVFQGLAAVAGLRAGRDGVKEPTPVKPVSHEQVEAVLPYLPPPLRAVVQIQALTGCRPGEALAMRGADIDRSGPVWVYRPQAHKGQWIGKRREILIGPKCQELLAPWIASAGDGYLFSPRRSEAKRNLERRANRRSPMTPSQEKRRPKPNRKRPWRERYDKCSYNWALRRACDRAHPHPELSAIEASELTEAQRAELRAWRIAHRWGPNRLRHLVGTRIRQQFGLEAAQIILGHAKADITQVYAERDIAKAMEIMKAVG